MNWRGFGSSCCLVEVLSQHLPRRTEENYGKPVRIAIIPAEIENQAPSKYKSRVLSLDQHVQFQRINGFIFYPQNIVDLSLDYDLVFN
jgi:hypothetical protein